MTARPSLARSGMSLPASPTADHVARAIVAAARALGEDPIAIAGGTRGSRARQYAAAALYELFPTVLVRLIAQYVGVSNVKTRDSLRANLAESKRSAWWNKAIAAAAREAVVSAPSVPAIEAAPIKDSSPALPAPKRTLDPMPVPRLKPKRAITGIIPLGEPAPGRSALDQKRQVG